MRGARPRAENTPYGRFWIGKSDAGSTGTKERSSGSLGSDIYGSSLSCPLPLRERVARISEAHSSRVRDCNCGGRPPTHPHFVRAPSPTRGEGKSHGFFGA